MKTKPKPPTSNVRAFLAAIRITPNVTWAAYAVGGREHGESIRRQHYARLKKDPTYREQYEAAREIGNGALEDRMMARAMDGVDEPVFYQGECCGYVTRYYHSEMLLRGAMPEKYREQVKVKGKLDVGLKFAGSLTELLALYHELTREEPAHE